jgi:hypothetical protein
VKSTALWDIAPCGLIEVDISEVHTASIIVVVVVVMEAVHTSGFSSVRLHGTLSQKAMIFILTVIRT